MHFWKSSPTQTRGSYPSVLRFLLLPFWLPVFPLPRNSSKLPLGLKHPTSDASKFTFSHKHSKIQLQFCSVLQVFPFFSPSQASSTSAALSRSCSCWVSKLRRQRRRSAAGSGGTAGGAQRRSSRSPLLSMASQKNEAFFGQKKRVFFGLFVASKTKCTPENVRICWDLVDFW